MRVILIALLLIGVLNLLLLGGLFLFGPSLSPADCAGKTAFNNAGGTRLFLPDGDDDQRPLTYGAAEARCMREDAALIEIWSDDEWKEVTHIMNHQQ